MQPNVVIAIFGTLLATGWGKWPLDGEWKPEYTNEVLKKSGEEFIDTVLSGGDCIGRRCLESDQCCSGSVCVDVDGTKGTCLPIYGRAEGDPCNRDIDCSDGLRCTATGDAHKSRKCQGASLEMKKKEYNDECFTSAECNANKRLCCQLQRRHRMAPRRVCYYFSDPKSCIGAIDSTYRPLKPVLFSSNPFFKARMG